MKKVTVKAVVIGARAALLENACEISPKNLKEQMYNVGGNAESSSLSDSAYIFPGKFCPCKSSLIFILFNLTTIGLED